MSEAEKIVQRARRYLEKMPAGISGANRHAATFLAADTLVNGFGLSTAEAWPLMLEYNQRCVPPNDLKKLEYRLNRALKMGNKKGRGFLLKPGTYIPSRDRRQLEQLAGAGDARAKKPEYDAPLLIKMAAACPEKIDLRWLGDRSSADPATVSRGGFLSALYAPGEKVKIFTKDKSQGQALWPCEEAKIPETGPLGVWFLAAPVDGLSHPNPRKPPTDKDPCPMSSRSEESVTSWRWMMIESDKAPAVEWLKVIVQMPLRIAALYTSGGRSVHALVRVDARTKGEWDERKRELAPWLVPLGADPGALSAVRLTRLPGCWREGKLVEETLPNGEKRDKYVLLKTAASPRGAFQKLLYLNPDAPMRPLLDLPRLRDVEAHWLSAADAGVADGDETGGAWLRAGLEYYAPCSRACREALAANF